MWLFLIFVLVPIIEIALFIQVGGFLGLWPTLLIVIATAFAGTILLRAQGFATLQNLQNSMATGQNPVHHIASGALILVAGVVLLTPGFFTDAVGLLLMIPAVRNAIIKWGSARMADAQNIHVKTNFDTNPQQPQQPNTVDAEYSVIDDDDSEEAGSSGWTKH